MKIFTLATLAATLTLAFNAQHPVPHEKEAFKPLNPYAEVLRKKTPEQIAAERKGLEDFLKKDNRTLKDRQKILSAFDALQQELETYNSVTEEIEKQKTVTGKLDRRGVLVTQKQQINKQTRDLSHSLFDTTKDAPQPSKTLNPS